MMANQRCITFEMEVWTIFLLGIVTIAQPVNAVLEIGCYPMNKTNPKFRVSGGNYDPTNVKHEDCIFACYIQSQSYSGLQAGHCLCSSTAYLTDPSPVCGDPCPGDEQQSCGNDTHVAVPVDPIPSNLPNIQLVEPTGTVIAGKPTELTVTGISVGDVTSSSKLGFEPGDGSLTIWEETALATSYVYPTSGHFVVVATGQRDLLLVAHDAVPITVVMETAGVCLQCPAVVAIEQPFDCTVEVIQGSDVTLTMSINDADMAPLPLGSTTFTLHGAIGLNGSQTTAETTTWILPSTESLQRTRLLAIEALISDVGSGTFTILVLKPKCPTGVYCATDNLCRSDSQCNYDASRHSNPLTQDTCTSNATTTRLYCIAKGGCSAASGGPTSCPAKPVRFDTDAIDPQRPGYEVVHLLPMEVSSPGLFRYNFSDTLCELFTLDVGYVLGVAFSAGGASIATQTDPELNTTVPLEYKSTINPTTLTTGSDLPVSSFQLDSARHLVRAIVVAPLISRPQLTLNSMGDFDVAATVTNTITPGGDVDRANVSAQITIIGLQCEDFKEGVRPHEEVFLEISVMNGSHISYTLDWGDGEQDDFYTLDSVPINQTHSYTTAGTYEVNIVASNLISNETIVVTIQVQNPVQLQHFLVTMASPQVVEGNGNATAADLVITVTNPPPADPLATNPQATITCLTLITCPQAVTVDLSTLTAHNQMISQDIDFTDHGFYTLSVTIFNLVSEETYEIKVSVYERLQGVKSFAQYKPSQSASSYATKGHGVLEDTFPLDRPVVFEMSFLSGSEVKYLVDFDDGSSLGNYSHEETPFDHLFRSVGEFNVVISASNPVTPTINIRTTIKTLQPIRGVRILDLGVSRVNETRYLNITVTDEGSNSCVVVDFGDGTTNEAYGTCGGHSNRRGNFTPPIGLRHVYPEQTSYEVQAMGWNTLSTDNATILIPVSEAKKYCGLPTVSIQDSKPGWWLPRVVVRKDRLAFQGITKLDCWFTDNSKEWFLERLDPQTGIQLEATMKLTTKESTLLIPAFTLEIGLYRLGYKVTMNRTLTDGLEFSSIGYDYIDVQRSQLVVALIDGQMTSTVKGWGSMLDLIPGKVSKDPDVPDEEEVQGFEKILYFCRRIGEKYPSKDIYIDIPEMREDPGNGTDEANDGGCFGTGPGRLNSSLPTLSWNTSLMETGVRYELLVIIKKDIRSGNFSLILELKEGDPPQAAISIGRGTIFTPGNGAQIVNPTGSVRLTASCSEFCNGVRYSWVVQGLNNSNYPSNLMDWQQWTSGGSEYLYIKSDFFSAFPQFSVFEVTAHATNTQRGEGYASMKIQLNQPPVSGSCTVHPQNITLGESVRIVCEDWKDWQDIVLYKFYAKSALFEAVLKNSAVPKVDVKPPLGSPTNDYAVSLSVTAEDTIGATTSLAFANITVSPPVNRRSENHSLEQERLYETLRSEENPEAINAQLLLDASLLLATESSSPDLPSEAPTEMDEQARQQQAAERAEKSQEIGRMVELQSSVVVSSSEDIVLMSSTISLITKDVSALSPNTLDTLSNVVGGMLSFVEDDPKSTKDESKLNSVGKGLISFAGNILMGVSESVSNPIDMSASGSSSHQSRNRLALAQTDEQQQDEELQKKAETTLSKLEDSMQRLYSLTVNNKLPGEQSTVFTSPQLTLSTSRQKAAELGNMTVDDGTGNIMMPGWCELMGREENCSTDEAVDMKLQSTRTNTYNFAKGSHADRQDGGLVNFTFFNNDTVEIPVSNLSDNNLINIHFSQLDATAEANFTTFDPTLGNGSFSHSFTVEGVGESVFIELRPGNETVVYALYISFNKTASSEDYDWMFIIPNVTDEEINDGSTTSRVPSTTSTPLTTASDFTTSDVSYNSTTNFPWTTEDLTTSANPSTNPPTTDNPSFTDYPTTDHQFMNMSFDDLFWNNSTDNTAGDSLNFDEAMPSKPISHTVMFGPKQHKGKLGTYFFRLAKLAEDETPENLTLNYSLRILQAECAFYQSETRQWSTEGVQVVLDERTNLPICQTSHLTPFTTTWIVKPVALDWDLVFDNLNPLENLTIYLTCGVIYTLFFFIFMWARRKDKKDVMMLGVTPLPDNNPSHSYMYEMIVVTGKRFNAGTESKVSFILSGEDDETKPRCLEDPNRQILIRGSIDRFLLTTAKPLGALNYMRIWHDNSGQGAAQSWYMSYIAIRDLQTKRRYFFLCNQWFSVVDGDGQVDRLLPVSGKEQMQEFSHVFSSQTGKHFNDGHLWVSIFTRPPGSRFTRMQRAMCCLMALWLEMLTSIMFYQAVATGSTVKPFSIGPFSLSPSEIAIGIESNLIVFPISLLMVQFFKKSRVRRKRPSRIQVAKEKQQKCVLGGNRVHPMKTRADNSDTVSSRDIFIISDDAKMDKDPSKVSPDPCPASNKHPPAKRNQRCSLPWWCVYLAWIICILATLAATTFTFFYGLQYANEKTTSWFRSIIISFFCGIILTQPIKVILVSLFIALVFKTPNADEDTDIEEDEEDCHLQEDEEWLHTLYGTSNVHPVAARVPPDPHVVERQRIKRIKELKMYAIIREILFSVIFVWLLSVFSYGNQDPFAFWTKDAHVKLLVRGDGNHTFMNASSIPKFWVWVNTGLVPGMFAGPWYNDQDPSPDEKNFLGDRYSKILGKVMFRQLRVPRGKCEVNPKMRRAITECNIDYSGAAQDEAKYGIGWTPLDPNGPEYPEYTFTDNKVLDSYPVWGRHALYLGGGYIYYVDTESVDRVRATVDKMYQEAWIDRYTRVLFIEFSVYNAQTNLFSFINLMVEILPTGGSYPNYRIDVLRLLTYHEGIGLVRVICEAVFFVFIICLTVRELFLIRKEGKQYFKQFWNLNELAIIIFSIVTMVVYFFRLFVTNSLLNDFAKKQSQKHINLQYVAYWNELMGYLLGLLVFLSTLKFLKLLRFNRRIGLLSNTIHSCSEELLNFTFMFSFVFVAFAAAFYLIFCNRLYNYSDILFTMETMMTAILGKFKFGELLVTESILGPLFFFCFTGYVCFVMINVFLTIIIGAFKTVKGDIANQSNEYEMIDFILSRFKSFTGIGGKKRKEEDELLPNLDMEEYEADLAKSLPVKVDQLLDRIAHVYFDQGTLNDFVKEVSAMDKKRKKKEELSKSRKIYLS
ncbi:uncharacterized protein LOC119737627 [Patiria miniata]|uniref:Uncharacterized protein n=1 Tax=Patiria miniata TaxID=46514 RepID=A0A914AWA0_PATMI|nr:uncharacterized protein LOC119737627 [Patiria miniata]